MLTSSTCSLPIICGYLGATSQNSLNLIIAIYPLTSNSCYNNFSKNPWKYLIIFKRRGITLIWRWPNDKIPQIFARHIFIQLFFDASSALSKIYFLKTHYFSIISPMTSIGDKKWPGLFKAMLVMTLETQASL